MTDEMAQKIADRINFEARVKLDVWHKVIIVLLVVQLLLAGWHLYYHEKTQARAGGIVPQATRTEPK